MTQPIVAAVDIGSATVHLLVGQLSPDGALRRYHEESIRPLLGARRDRAGDIPADAEADVLAALRHYQDVAAQFGARQLVVVATEAVRAARNGGRIVSRLQRALGLPVAVLTAAQETRLAMLGAYEGRVPEVGLFVDSGGASTQIAIIADRAISRQQSLPIGAGSLTADHLGHDPPTPDEMVAAKRGVARVCAVLPPAPPAGADWEPVITGGSANTLAMLPSASCQAGVLTQACLADLERRLAGQSTATLAQRYSLTPERARIVYAGCLIIQQLLHWSGHEIWRVSIAGIREGIIRTWSADSERWLIDGVEDTS